MPLLVMIVAFLDPLHHFSAQCQLCGQLGHIATQYTQRAPPSYQPSDATSHLAALSVNESFDPSWYLDTGATSHMTYDSGILSNSQPYCGLDTVAVGDGTTLPIKAIGNFSIDTSNSSFHLPGTLYVPSLHKNLLSVQKFTK